MMNCTTYFVLEGLFKEYCCLIMLTIHTLKIDKKFLFLWFVKVSNEQKIPEYLMNQSALKKMEQDVHSVSFSDY